MGGRVALTPSPDPLCFQMTEFAERPMIRFQFDNEPHLRCHAQRDWGGLSATRIHATPGRHAAGPRKDHRLVFYEVADVAAACDCEGLRRTHTLANGTFDLVPAGAAGVWEDAGPVQFVSIRFAPGLLLATAEALTVRGSVDLAPKLGARDPVIERIARALAAQIESPTPAARVYADSLGAALGARLLQNFRAGGDPRRRSLSKPQLRRIAAFIDEHLAEDLSLGRIADVAQVSVPHLTAMFRRTTGQTVHRYIMERRVHQARALLMQRRLTIAQVASEVGFAHQSHLARWTRRILGATPAQIRES